MLSTAGAVKESVLDRRLERSAMVRRGWCGEVQSSELSAGQWSEEASAIAYAGARMVLVQEERGAKSGEVGEGVGVGVEE